MKKIDVQNAVNAFGRIAVSRVKDEKIRSTLIYDYRNLRKASRTIDQERSDLVDKFQSDFAEEVHEVAALRNAGQSVAGHMEFLVAESKMNTLMKGLFREEIDVDLQRIALDDFVRAVKDGEYTFEDLAVLDGIILE